MNCEEGKNRARGVGGVIPEFLSSRFLSVLSDELQELPEGDDEQGGAGDEVEGAEAAGLEPSAEVGGAGAEDDPPGGAAEKDPEDEAEGGGGSVDGGAEAEAGEDADEGEDREGIGQRDREGGEEDGAQVGRGAVGGGDGRAGAQGGCAHIVAWAAEILHDIVALEPGAAVASIRWLTRPP